MPITDLTYHNPILVSAPKIDTDLLWALTIVFIGLALLYFISVFFFRNKISAQSSKTAQRKKELSPMISEFLFYEDDVDKTEKSRYIDLKIQIRELLKNDFNRRVLTEILLDLRKDVSGDTKKRLFKLYQDLGLEKDAFEKLESWRWEIISKGISHLTQMQVKSAYGFITKFINHRRSTVRKQAEIATVTLKPEGINYFLDTTRYKISEWQQLKLLDVIRNQEDLDPPRFKMWLTATNKHVVLFALRLIKYYNQNDANASLIELVKHKNNQIKTEALSCINEFHVVEAIPTLKQVFYRGNVDVKIAILGTIGNLGSTADIEFLQDVAQREGNFSVKSKAIAAINMITPGTIMPTNGIENVGDYAASDIGFDNSSENNSKAATETLGNGIPFATQEINSKASNDGILEAENHGQEEMLQEPDNETPHESWIVENDGDKNFETVEKGSIDPLFSGILSKNQDIEEKNVSKEATIDKADSIEEKSIGEDKHETTGIAEETNAASERIDEEIVLKPQEPIPQTSGPEPDRVSKKHFKNLQEANSFHLDFIPIVVTDESRPIQNLEKYKPMANAEKPELDPKHIEVDFEEVTIVKTGIQKDIKTKFFDISEIDFLPIVVDSEKNTNESESFDENENNNILPMNIEVFYEEVKGLVADEESQDLINEINELGFLPIVTDGEIGPEENNGIEEPRVLNEVEGYTLSDFEVDFEETPTPVEDEKIAFDMEGSPIIDVEGPAVEDVMSWLMAHNELREIELQYETVSPLHHQDPITDLIPEPVYYDEHEAYMMGLLDDLEELGDSREIPLLEELLAVEKKIFIKDRITLLIAQFSMQRDGKAVNNHDEQKADLPVFSVFADLFKNIDTESKLILLDEIVAVGDEKEIEFLDGLLEDSNPGIRKKAQTALKLLIAKISDSETISSDKKKQKVEVMPTHLFDCGISTGDSVKYTAADTDEGLTNEMEHQSSDEREIFEIDFEPAESLDKEHNKQILNLPVIATEISPNGASFLFQLYGLLKIIAIN